MQHLFVYGSLLFPELTEKLTGKTFKSVVAILSGFKRFALKGCDYPAIIPKNSSDVEGLLLLNVDEESMKILTFFEGGEYKKQDVVVTSEKKKYTATAFVWAKSELYPEDFDWDLNTFRKASLQFYLEKVVPETVKEFRTSGL